MMMDLDEKGMDAQEHEETVCYVLWHVIHSVPFLSRGGWEGEPKDDVL